MRGKLMRELFKAYQEWCGFPVRPLRLGQEKHNNPIFAYQEYAGVGFDISIFLWKKLF